MARSTGRSTGGAGASGGPARAPPSQRPAGHRSREAGTARSTHPIVTARGKSARTRTPPL
jgi:hypothetical protein